MPSRSHRKGDNGEREICKILTRIFGENFARVPTSGAMVGGINVARKANLSETQLLIYKGDVIPPDSLPRMVVEVKFYADFPFHQLVQNNDIRLLDLWMDQAKSATSDHDTWFLTFKINRRGWFVAFDRQHANLFDIYNFAQYKSAIICEAVSFFEQNRERVATLCGRRKGKKNEIAHRPRGGELTAAV